MTRRAGIGTGAVSGWSGIMAGVLCAASSIQAAPAPSDAGPLLADHVCQLAQDNLRSTALSRTAFREASVLLSAASRLDPREPRYPRLLASAMSQLGDLQGEIEAWNQYLRERRELGDEQDRSAQQQVIDLYYTKIQTADAKLAYLKDLIGKESIPREVRAHAAVLAVPLLLERSHDDALAMTETAIGLYPLPEAMAYRYQLTARDGTPAERVRGLVGMLRANPNQPRVIEAMAQELAVAGLASDSVEWYSAALALCNRSGIVPSHQFAADYVAELYLAGQPRQAGALVTKLLEMDPTDPDFWFLKLTVERAAGEQAEYAKSLKLAHAALVRRWTAVAGAILSDATAASQPTSRPAGEGPDPLAVVARLGDPEASKYMPDVVSALGNLAWLDVYYGSQPDVARPLVEALQVVVGDDPLIARLQGWVDLESGKLKEAVHELSAVSDKDVLAALGLFKLAESGKNTGDVAALRKRIEQTPASGVLAAVVYEGLHNSAVGAAATMPADVVLSTTRPTTIPATLPATVSAVRAELEKFPRDWMSILDEPQRFYQLVAEPLQVAHQFGEPFLARVTIKNIGNYDLFIGPAGVLQPHLWFDAIAQGTAQQNYPAIAYDRVANVTVLPPLASTSQIIRIDQGPLGQSIRQRPTGSITVSGLVMTNPVQTADDATPGAAGYRAMFLKNFVQLPADVRSGAAKQAFLGSLASGSGAEKIQTLDLLSAYLRGLSGPLDEGATSYAKLVATSSDDALPDVAGWAAFLASDLPGIDKSQSYIEKLSRSGEWQNRLLALIAVRSKATALRRQVAAPLAKSDPEPLVKTYAACVIDEVEHPATQPATQSTASPAGPAVAPGGPSTQPAH